MSGAETWPWAAILALGVWHGINPGMGWLFAVALGVQEGEGSAVWRSLPPLAVGHGLAIAAAVGLAGLAGLVVPVEALKWGVAAVLFGFGLFRLLSSRHPRFGGMRVGGRDLAVWSFLMASAHGAGLMVLPFVLGAGEAARGAAAGGHAAHVVTHAGVGGVSPALAATLVHTAGYLLITALVALVVYRKVGLRLLRSLWVNLDVVWGVALLLTAAVTPLL